MGNADHGAVFGQMINGRLHFGFRLRIQRCGGFVEDEDGCVAHKCLAIAMRCRWPAEQLDAALANGRVVALLLLHDKIVRVRAARAAASISARVASGLPQAIFSATVMLKRTISLTDERHLAGANQERRSRAVDAVDFDGAAGGS